MQKQISAELDLIKKQPNKRYLYKDAFVHSLLLVLLYEKLIHKHHVVKQTVIYKDYLGIDRQTFQSHIINKAEEVAEAGIMVKKVGRNNFFKLNMEQVVKYLSEY